MSEVEHQRSKMVHGSGVKCSNCPSGTWVFTPNPPQPGYYCAMCSNFMDGTTFHLQSGSGTDAFEREFREAMLKGQEGGSPFDIKIGMAMERKDK